jgi:hypothetical protein
MKRPLRHDGPDVRMTQLEQCQYGTFPTGFGGHLLPQTDELPPGRACGRAREFCRWTHMTSSAAPPGRVDGSPGILEGPRCGPYSSATVRPACADNPTQLGALGLDKSIARLVVGRGSGDFTDTTVHRGHGVAAPMSMQKVLRLRLHRFGPASGLQPHAYSAPLPRSSARASTIASGRR